MTMFLGSIYFFEGGEGRGNPNGLSYKLATLPLLKRIYILTLPWTAVQFLQWQNNGLNDNTDYPPFWAVYKFDDPLLDSPGPFPF
jgi:hypothetical protein